MHHLTYKNVLIPVFITVCYTSINVKSMDESYESEKNVHGLFSRLTSDRNIVKASYNVHNPNDKYSTICWNEITTLHLYTNGTTLGYVDYSISLDLTPEIPSHEVVTLPKEKYEIHNAAQDTTQILDFVTVQKNIDEIIKQNKTVICKSDKKHLQKFTDFGMNKRVEISLRPVAEAIQIKSLQTSDNANLGLAGEVGQTQYATVSPDTAEGRILNFGTTSGEENATVTTDTAKSRILGFGENSNAETSATTPGEENVSVTSDNVKERILGLGETSGVENASTVPADANAAEGRIFGLGKTPNAENSSSTSTVPGDAAEGRIFGLSESTNTETSSNTTVVPGNAVESGNSGLEGSTNANNAPGGNAAEGRIFDLGETPNAENTSSTTPVPGDTIIERIFGLGGSTNTETASSTPAESSDSTAESSKTEDVSSSAAIPGDDVKERILGFGESTSSKENVSVSGDASESKIGESSEVEPSSNTPSARFFDSDQSSGAVGGYGQKLSVNVQDPQSASFSSNSRESTESGFREEGSAAQRISGSLIQEGNLCNNNKKVKVKVNMQILDDEGQIADVDKKIELNLDKVYQPITHSGSFDQDLGALITDYYGKVLDKYKNCRQNGNQVETRMYKDPYGNIDYQQQYYPTGPENQHYQQQFDPPSQEYQHHQQQSYPPSQKYQHHQQQSYSSQHNYRYVIRRPSVTAVPRRSYYQDPNTKGYYVSSRRLETDQGANKSKNHETFFQKLKRILTGRSENYKNIK